MTIAVHSCVRGKIPMHFPMERQFRCMHVWGVRSACIYMRDDDFGAFMCEGWNLGAFTWRATISVHICVRGTIPVHLLEGWWFRCIHMWRAESWCTYLRSDDFGAFMCEGYDSGAISWGMTISVHICVRGRISVHLPEEGRFRCIHVWGVRFRCIYLRNDYVSAIMCEGWDSNAFIWGVTISVHSCVRCRIPVHLLEGWWFRCIHVRGVGFWCIYLRSDNFGAFMCEG